MTASQSCGQDDMFDRELSSLGLAVCPSAHNGDVPLVGRLVELGSFGIEGRSGPDVDFQDIDIRLQEVCKLSSGSEDWPVGGEWVKGEMIGIDRIV